MRIQRLLLNGFRNYEWETVDFGENINVIAGANAQGKTNLLEAVTMLSLGHSFRTRFDREVIGFSFDSAQILARVTSGDRELDMEMNLTRGTGKKIKINSVKKTAGELPDYMRTVLFCPDDLNLIKEGAAARRRLLDDMICQIRPKYSQLLAEYNRLYEHKLRILKDWHEKPSLLDTLDDFSEGMCRISAQMIRYRAYFSRELAYQARVIHSEFSGNNEQLDVRYTTVSTVTDAFAPAKEIYFQVCEHQEAHRRAEIESGQCLTGIHKDDLVIDVNGNNAKSYASQGQTRTAALSLKLAEREIFQTETGEMPVLLLDDVLSELDAKRQEFVLNRIGGGQTLITCCEDEGISSRTGGCVFSVERGKIKECT